MGWWCHFKGHGRRHWGHDEVPEALSDKGLLALALEALEKAPGSGYDVVKTLEERLDGIWAIGPQGIYPVLRLAEDAGFVTAGQADGKTTYTLTDAGKAYLDERREALAALWGRVDRARYRAEVGDLFRELKGLAWTFREEIGDGRLDDARLAKIKEAIALARQALRDDKAS